MNRRGLNTGNTMSSQSNIDEGSWKGVSEGSAMLPSANSSSLNPDANNQSGFPREDYHITLAVINIHKVDNHRQLEISL